MLELDPRAVADLLEPVSLTDGMRVLSLVSGKGDVLQALHRAAYAAMVTLDITATAYSEEDVPILEALASRVVMNSTPLEGMGPFDLIVTGPAAGVVVQHGYSLLKPGGWIHALVPFAYIHEPNRYAMDFKDWVFRKNGISFQTSYSSLNIVRLKG